MQMFLLHIVDDLEQNERIGSRQYSSEARSKVPASFC